MTNRLTVIDFDKLDGKALNENFTPDAIIDLMLKVYNVSIKVSIKLSLKKFMTRLCLLRNVN